jgi:uncharacterized BrkB/YihY/UPF0761 family membrane protein
METELDSATGVSRDSRFARPAAVYGYLLGAGVLGVTALFGGGTLLLDPTGSSMGMPLEWLEGTPFTDYTVPGLVLFAVLGIGSFVVMAAILRRWRWARTAGIGLGVVLVGWLVVQVALIQLVHAFHFLYGAIGVVLATLPFTRRFRNDLRQ